MIRALLLDLDNTLLRNNMDDFVPAYLAALTSYVADRFEPQQFVRHLLRATGAMSANDDPARTNREAFDAVFFPALGGDRAELDPLFAKFYATRFAELRGLTAPDPAARPLIEWTLARGLQLVVATNPLFPLTAIEQRLAWAGVPVSEFPYSLVTSYESMHATKPHRAYYLEIAARLDRRPDECIMVGDDWKMDVRPALATGMQAYWIAPADGAKPPENLPLAGQGTLADFARWVALQA